MLIDFFLGDVLSETREQQAGVRLQSLVEARRFYLAFLTTCAQYNLVHTAAISSFKRYNSDEVVADPSVARAEKIAQKREESALREHIQTLQSAVDRAARDGDGA